MVAKRCRNAKEKGAMKSILAGLVAATALLFAANAVLQVSGLLGQQQSAEGLPAPPASAWVGPPPMAHSFGGLGNLPLGKAAPDLTLTSVADGRPLRLADLHAEKPLVLIFCTFT
jgi:hypothetical protein